jgi:FtsP/CotA-like multicopper oxidase with cupredoxin domain
MSGMVMGVTVTGAARHDTTPDNARRRIRMQIDPDSRQGAVPTFTVNVEGTQQPSWRLSEGPMPGPVLVLTRGEPVAVEIANRLTQPTAIHWHGIELESYDDGVPGFGGGSGSVTPPVAAGGTFTARFTPARAGTFIYHTHWHDTAQLSGGIYGPLIVLEPGQTFDRSTDHIVMLGLDGPYVELVGEPFAVNGQNPPKPFVLKAGATNRIRIINITADNVALTVQLTSRFDPVQWTLVSKDGAATPPVQRTPRQARQLVTVGETFDYEIAPAVLASDPLWMELRRGSGELLMQWRLLVK